MVDIRVLCSLYVSNQNSVFVMSVKQVSIPDLNVLRSGDGCGVFFGSFWGPQSQNPGPRDKSFKILKN